MSAAGRNDQCSCGSGFKYKNCCLGKEEAARPFYTREDWERALARLMRLSIRPEFEGNHQAAQIGFWGDSFAGRSDDDIREALALPPAQARSACTVRDGPPTSGRCGRSWAWDAREEDRSGTAARAGGAGAPVFVSRRARARNDARVARRS